MLSHTVTEIQSLGVRIASDSPKRRVGAGPAEGGTIILDGIPVHVPLSGNFVSRSPYSLRLLDDEFWLFKDGECILPAKVKSRPKFYDYVTNDQIPYSNIALLHGRDCVASTVRQTCTYWSSDKRCQFCGIELSLSGGQTTKLKTPAQLVEVILKAVELDSVTNVVLTTGAALPPGQEIDYLARCVRAIKQVCDIPIHTQFLPPNDSIKLHDLKKAGADTVGIHIESFDMGVLSRVAPLKASIGVQMYEKAWNLAVEVFGFNQVSSFLIVGLGEQNDSVVTGSQFLAERGVFPFLVPFRPIPGSTMQDHPTPCHERMKRLYEKILPILQKNQLSSQKSLAGCVRCGACSAVQSYEREGKVELMCHPAKNKLEIAAALRIRNEVFVEEQHLFETSDLDENDSKSTHIVAKYNGEIIGAVRVFPEKGLNGHWVGGRLAVQKESRDKQAGALLVREAMSYVKKQCCTRFTAHIQKQNVRFFSLLGWKAVGAIEIYHGKPHQLMEADLDKL